jgi:hypothetical protein
LINQNELARPKLMRSALGANAQIFGAVYTALELAEDELARRIDPKS